MTSFGALVERVSIREYPRIPTGVGFCLYIRRVALQRVSFYAEAHCDYLQTPAELGISEALAAGGAIIALMLRLAQKIRRAADHVGPEIIIILMMLAGLTAAAVAWPLLEQPAPATPLLLAAGRGWRLLDDSAHSEHPD